jgi:hypothetical protein
MWFVSFIHFKFTERKNHLEAETKGVSWTFETVDDSNLEPLPVSAVSYHLGHPRVTVESDWQATVTLGCPRWSMIGVEPTASLHIMAAFSYLSSWIIIMDLNYLNFKFIIHGTSNAHHARLIWFRQGVSC